MQIKDHFNTMLIVIEYLKKKHLNTLFVVKYLTCPKKLVYDFDSNQMKFQNKIVSEPHP